MIILKEMSLLKKSGQYIREFGWTMLHMYQPTRNRNMKYTVALCMIAALTVYLLLSDVPKPLVPHKPHFTICIFKIITGIPCPACGTTRGLKYLFHGMPLESLMMNPMAILTAAYMAVTAVWIICDLISGKSSYLDLYSRDLSRRTWIIILILAGINWVWNIVKGL